MAKRAVTVDVRLLIATWPSGNPRGAVVRFCEANGLSRSRFYELREVAREHPDDLGQILAERSRRPRSSPQATALEVEDLAVRVRKQLQDDGWDYGPISVAHEMQRLGVTPPSRATLARIFTRRGLVVPSPQKRPRSSWRRFVFLAPNACWQIDATEWTLLDGTTAAIFQILDDHSRRLLASLAASGETSEAAVQVVSLAIKRFGVPVLFLSDNGPAFNPSRRGQTGKLVVLLQSLGCKPITARPFHPQTCGKNERVHSTLKRWLEVRPRAATLTELQAQLDEFDLYYNTRRPHQALDGHTPEHAWNATPTAAAPTPPNTDEHPTSARAPLTATQPMATGNGKVWIGNKSIHLGYEHIGHRVLVLRDGDHIDVFTSTGVHIRSLQLEAGRNHYASGRPRGGTTAMKRSAGSTNPKQPSGMS
jgi:putative transposase